MEHPIDNIIWIPVDDLRANQYNPNVVFDAEFRLLERSILSTGWVQPILVSRAGDGFEIIDGFHRAMLAKTSERVRDLTNGMVPCAVLDLSHQERMLLTVRMNRAKGSHIACRMHDLVTRLVNDHGLPPGYIADSIGATTDEVNLLLQENVFKAMDIKNHRYSRAWEPR